MEWARSLHESKAPDSGSGVRGSDLAAEKLMARERDSLRLTGTWRVQAEGPPRCSVSSHRLPFGDYTILSQSSLWSNSGQGERLAEEWRCSESVQRQSFLFPFTDVQHPVPLPKEIFWGRRWASLSLYLSSSNSHVFGCLKRRHIKT